MAQNNHLEYYEFAINDYFGLKKSINAGIFYTGMASLCQSICERFLKEIIVQKVDKETIEENSKIMSTHNLRSLCSFINNNSSINLSAAQISNAEGFYFSSRYPGKDSFIANEDDILLAFEAVEYCKISTEEILDIVS